MASTRTNLLIDEDEEEEEKMKNELIKAGFHETMDKLEMIKIYQILQESKESSLMNKEISALASINDFKSTQNTSNTPEYTSFGVISNASSKIATTSTNFIERSSVYQLSDKENSPESILTKSLEKNLNDEKISPDNEKNNQDFLTDKDFPSLRENYDINESNSGHHLKKDETTKEKQLARWRLNPFEFVQNKSVPLDVPEHIRSRFDPIVLPNDFADSEIFDTMCQKVIEIMDNIHERFNITTESVTNRKTNWGSPIKVATNWNGSLDKNPDDEDSPESDLSTSDILDRVSKRKALRNIDAATYDSNDENSDDEFANTKKRKCQQEKIAEEVAKKNQESQQSKSSFASTIEMIEVDDTKDLLSLDLNDNSNLSNLPKNSSTKSSTNTESNYELLQYPRRILPPISTKKNFKGPKTTKKNIIQSKKDLYVNDEEINKTLHELNEEIDDNDCIDITDEKKNSPISIHLKNKIQKARSYLETMNVAMEQRTKVEEELKKQKEREEAIKKDELICKRLQALEDENSRRIERERIFNEKQKEYALKLKPKITKLNFNKSYPTTEDITEDILLSENDDELATLSTSRSSTCPICQKFFPFDEIESHASECDAFFSEPDDISDNQPCSSRLSYECQICNKFSTYDGNDYAEHVNVCMKRMEDQTGIYFHR